MKKFFHGQMSQVNIRNNMIHAEEFGANPYTKGIDRDYGPWIGNIDAGNAHEFVKPEDECHQKTEHGVQTNQGRHADKHAKRECQRYPVRRFFNAEDLPELIPEVRNARTPVQRL